MIQITRFEKWFETVYKIGSKWDKLQCQTSCPNPGIGPVVQRDIQLLAHQSKGTNLGGRR
uniref:Uncharacterized protein n=1 Tax=Romanomermis culicivorax TaxID=13658 RepID=A0A915L676_ROMCU